MIKLRIIAFFLCLVVMCQMLSSFQSGKMLGKSQTTEEQRGDASDDDASNNELAHFNNPFLPSSGYPSVIIAHFSETKALAYIHFSDQIPSNHSTDVVSPPPDSIL